MLSTLGGQDRPAHSSRATDRRLAPAKKRYLLDDEIAVQDNGPVFVEENQVQRSSVRTKRIDPIPAGARSTLTKSQPILETLSDEPYEPDKEEPAEAPLSNKLLELKRRRKELKHRVLGRSVTNPNKPVTGVTDTRHIRAADLSLRHNEER